MTRTPSVHDYPEGVVHEDPSHPRIAQRREEATRERLNNQRFPNAHTVEDILGKDRFGELSDE